MSPTFDLNSYVKEAEADPYVLEWGEHTYTVKSPPWASIVQFQLKDAESFTVKEMDRLLSMFFGPDDYRQIQADGLDDNMKVILFMDVMTFTGERMPEGMVPKAEQIMKAKNGKAGPRVKA